MARKKLHSIDALDREILRLKLRQKEQELKLSRDLNAFRSKGLLRVLGSALFGKKESQGPKGYAAFFGRLGDKLTDRFAGRLESFIENIFKRR